MLLPTSMTLMITAAVVSSFLVLRMRPAGCAAVSSGSPSTSGITATPVSNPDRPSARRGNSSMAKSTIDQRIAVLVVAAAASRSETLPGARHR